MQDENTVPNSDEPEHVSASTPESTGSGEPHAQETAVFSAMPPAYEPQRETGSGQAQQTGADQGGSGWRVDNNYAPQGAPSFPTPPPASYAQQQAPGMMPAQGFPGQGMPPYYPQPPKKKSHLKWWLTGAIVLIVLILGVFAAVKIVNNSRTPEAAVEQYMHAIADGKADEATKMVDPGVANSARVLLTDEVLGAADTNMTVVSVDTTSEFDGDAQVTVVYALDGEQFDYEFSVHQGDNSLLFLHNWEVQNALLSEVSLSSAGFSALNVEGKTVELTDEDGGNYAELYAYPGTYTVSSPDGGSEYLSADDQEMVVAPVYGEDYVSVSMDAEPTDAVQDVVLDEVKKQMESCASVEGNLDEVCPYPVQSTTLATLELKSTPDGFESFDSGYFESGEGSITLKENPSDWDEKPEAFDVDFSLYGEFEFDDDGQPIVTIDGSYY